VKFEASLLPLTKVQIRLFLGNQMTRQNKKGWRNINHEQAKQQSQRTQATKTLNATLSQFYAIYVFAISVFNWLLEMKNINKGLFLSIPGPCSQLRKALYTSQTLGQF